MVQVPALVQVQGTCNGTGTALWPFGPANDDIPCQALLNPAMPCFSSHQRRTVDFHRHAHSEDLTSHYEVSLAGAHAVPCRQAVEPGPGALVSDLRLANRSMLLVEQRR